jgi:hypothetical protein
MDAGSRAFPASRTNTEAINGLFPSMRFFLQAKPATRHVSEVAGWAFSPAKTCQKWQEMSPVNNTVSVNKEQDSTVRGRQDCTAGIV